MVVTMRGALALPSRRMLRLLLLMSQILRLLMLLPPLLPPLLLLPLLLLLLLPLLQLKRSGRHLTRRSESHTTPRLMTTSCL